ncbi:AraC family transcriptional regulator [Sphaerisporangium sp. NPDC049003]|uniref:AraC family transcriptional regulator n=1 Tax=Sphaerisporangium sp. NPDC049003 TaxID=3364517 RepID=UPI00371B5427
MGGDWSRYWRSPDRPLEAMHAHFERHVYHRHSHETYSFGFTEEGAQSFTCRGSAHTSAAGMVMVFNPDDPHDGHATDKLGFTYRMVHIGPDLVANVLSEAAERVVGLPLFTEPVVPDAGLARSLRGLHEALLGGATPLRRDELLDTMVVAMARRAGAWVPDLDGAGGRAGVRGAGMSGRPSLGPSAGPGLGASDGPSAGSSSRRRSAGPGVGSSRGPSAGPSVGSSVGSSAGVSVDPRMGVRTGAGGGTARVVRELLHDGDDGGISASDLAAAAGRSRFAVYRSFQAAYGMAPSDYQRQLRLRTARRLLVQGHSLAEIAAMTGFTDQSHLTRWFARYFGVTPGAYRRAVATR